jgi:hypothetical protein
MRFAILILSLSSVLVVACGQDKKNKPDVSNKNNVQTYTFENETTAQRVFKSSTLTCKDGQCPEGVGGLTSYSDVVGPDGSKGYEVGACTHTLISPDRILTNKHCLPVDLQVKGQSCEKRILIKFPASRGKPAENIECGKIVDFSEPSTETVIAQHPDWAVIELKTSSSRQPVPTNTDGIENKTGVALFPVFYNLDNRGETVLVTGEVRKTECKTNHLSDITEFFFHKFSAIFGVADCSETIIHGNSGSGLFSPEQQLIGVGSYTNTDSDGKSVNKMGGTNLACIHYFNENPSVFCSFDEDDNDLRFKLLELKFYQVMNEDSFYSIKPEEKSIQGPSFLRQGAGVQVFEAPRNGEDDGSFRANPEVHEFYKQQFSEVLFKNSGSCVASQAPEMFTAQIPVYSLDFANVPLGAVIKPLPLEQVDVNAKFRRKNDFYEARIQFQKISDTNSKLLSNLNKTQVACLISNNGGSYQQTGMLFPCFLYEAAKASLGNLSLEEKNAINTNWFLWNLEVKNIGLKIPICD